MTAFACCTLAPLKFGCLFCIQATQLPVGLCPAANNLQAANSSFLRLPLADIELADGLDCLVCCIIQVVCSNNGVLTGLQDLLALLYVCALKPDNQRHLQPNLHGNSLG